MAFTPLDNAAVHVLGALLEGIAQGRLTVVGFGGVDTPTELSASVRWAEVAQVSSTAQVATVADSAPVPPELPHCPECGKGTVHRFDDGAFGCRHCGHQWPSQLPQA